MTTTLTTSGTEKMRRIHRASMMTPNPATGAFDFCTKYIGGSGDGKSAILEDESQLCGLPAGDDFTLIASLREPPDFLGLQVPFTNEDAGEGEPALYTEVAPPDWFVAARAAKYCTVFFDELTRCTQAVQNGLLRVFNERRVGKEALPTTVRIVAAHNPPEDGGWELTDAMENRFCTVPWEIDVGDVTGFLLSNAVAGRGRHAADGSNVAKVYDAIDPVAEQRRVLSLWDVPWSNARGAISGFLTRRPAMLHTKPNRADEHGLTGAFASPRSWYNTARVLAIAPIYGLTADERNTMVRGLVGTAAAVEFAAWEKAADLPDVVELLDGRVQWKHDATRLDRSAAVLAAAATHVAAPDKDQKRRKARAAVAWSLLDQVASAGAIDICIVPARTMVEEGRLWSGKQADAVMGKLLPLKAYLDKRAKGGRR